MRQVLKHVFETHLEIICYVAFQATPLTARSADFPAWFFLAVKSRAKYSIICQFYGSEISADR
jgi:hypothetical protein